MTYKPPGAVCEDGLQALRHRLGEYRAIQPPDLVILLGIVTHSGCYFRMFLEIGLDLGLTPRVHVEQTVGVCQQVDFMDRVTLSSHLIRLTMSRCRVPTCRVRSVSRPRDSLERSVPIGTPNIHAASSYDKPSSAISMIAAYCGSGNWSRASVILRHSTYCSCLGDSTMVSAIASRGTASLSRRRVFLVFRKTL